MENQDWRTGDCSSDSLSFGDCKAGTKASMEKTTSMASSGSRAVQGSLPKDEPVIVIDMNALHVEHFSLFSPQFQEMVIRVVFQSTAALVGLSPGLAIADEAVASVGALGSTSLLESTYTWNKMVHNMSSARMTRKSHILQTSAGEDSDSQEDFPIPTHETSQQRIVRLRRLNRSQGKKAKELTENRKAVKKTPYVIHVDGTGRARGTHKHIWRSAVRGQCGRLDPTMDNINHHPKQVVDSIWHAIEGEWEFQGFAHKAREMFEKSGTRFMRNRKMQLKYKCQKNPRTMKLNDITDAHWAKIMKLAKETLKQLKSSCSSKTTKKKMHEEDEGHMTSEQSSADAKKHDLQGEEASKQHCRRRSPQHEIEPRDTLAIEAEEVDERIKSLRRELFLLESSKKRRKSNVDKQKHNEMSETVSNGFVKVDDIVDATHFVKTREHTRLEGECTTTEQKSKVEHCGTALERAHMGRQSECASTEHGLQRQQSTVEWEGTNLEDNKMECGDVVSMMVEAGGAERKIGEGVVLGHPGSKFHRKVISKGWHIVKVLSTLADSSLERCPIPSRWKEHPLPKIVNEAEGKIILWPDMFLQQTVK